MRASARPRKLTRAEKKERIREALFDAAVKVVGEHGYAATMVSMITAKASVAQGTFYNYFETLQDLLDQLLPTLGRKMLEWIKQAAEDAETGLEREERSFRAFFEFLRENPEFYRILYEAEVFAPAAFKKHHQQVTKGYVRVLERALDRGELRCKTRRELEAVALILMGARHYLCMHFVRSDRGAMNLPEWVVEAYMALIKTGVFVSPRAAK